MKLFILVKNQENQKIFILAMLWYFYKMADENLSTVKIGDFVRNNNFVFNIFSIVICSWSVMLIKCYGLDRHF